MKQTAVEWLIQQIQSDTFCDHIQGVRCWDKDTLMEFLEKAKQMEKKQIMNAYKCGRLEINRVQHDFLTKEEKHYDETYNPNSKFQLKK